MWVTLPEGRLDTDRVADWVKAISHFPNLAGKDKLRDGRATRWIDGCIAAHVQASSGNRNVAKAIIALLDQGKIQARLPKGAFVHVPAIYRALEAIVMRVHDVVVGGPEWFQPYVGRNQEDQMRAKRLGYWHQYLHEQGALLNTVEPLIRNLLVHKSAMIWHSWEIRSDTVLNRVTEKKNNRRGTATTKVKIEESEKVTFEGMRYQVVDGFDQILDHQAATPEDMRWVGRRYHLDDEAVREFGRTGWWENIQEALDARGERPAGTSTPALGLMPSSKLAIDQTIGRMAAAAGAPDMNEIHEVWGLWSEDTDKPVREYVGVLCNKVLVQVRRNFLFDQERPGAVVTYSRDSRQLIGTGPIEMALPLQGYLDQIYACVLRSFQNSVAPPVVARGVAMAMPGSLWDVEPGRIFHVGNDPSASLETMRFPSSMNDGLAMMRTVMTQIEEILGAPRFWEGSDTTGTATEIDTRQIESNKKLSYPAHAIARLMRKTLRIEDSMSRQFVTEGRVLHALGGGALDVVEVGTVRPEDFGNPVDYIIPGPEQLDMYGLRATRVGGWISSVFPMLSAAGTLGQLDFLNIAKETAELMLGPQFAKKVFPVDDSEFIMSPQEENEILAGGERVEIRKADIDETHIPSHKDAKRFARSDKARLEIERHIKAHEAQQFRKRAAQTRREQQQKQAVTMPDKLAPQEGRSGRSGGAYQRPADILPAVTSATPAGETPGPGRISQNGAADRQTATPQVGNR